VEQASAAAESMQDQAARLAKAVAVFKLDHSGTIAAPQKVEKTAHKTAAKPASHTDVKPSATVTALPTRKAAAPASLPVARSPKKLVANDAGDWEEF
jgi:hypothetical protein